MYKTTILIERAAGAVIRCFVRLPDRYAGWEKDGCLKSRVEQMTFKRRLKIEGIRNFHKIMLLYIVTEHK